MENQKPFYIYLDSSDYSILSDPRRYSHEYKIIRERLHDWVEAGDVCIFFSQVLLAEMAPITYQNEHLAQAKAELLFSLCRKNALIAPDRLITFEVEKLRGEPHDSNLPYSYDGIWFQNGTDTLPSPLARYEIIKSCLDETKNMGLNRKQRRETDRKIKKCGAARLQAQVKQQALSLSILDEEIQKNLHGYPLKKEDIIIIMRYMAGVGGAQEARAAYRRSLSDSRWIIKWMYADIKRSKDFADGIRAPGIKLCEKICQLRDSLSRFNTSDYLSNDFLNQQNRRSIEQVANALISKIGSHDTSVTINQLKEFCPGLHTMLAIFYSASKSSIQKNRNAPKSSDYVDALHAIYAPYVDVFRADSSMAPHVKQYAPAETQVVQKLNQLVPTIERLLNK